MSLPTSSIKPPPAFTARSAYSVDFKLEVANAGLKEGRNKTAQKYGMSAPMVGKWMRSIDLLTSAVQQSRASRLPPGRRMVGGPKRLTTTRCGAQRVEDAEGVGGSLVDLTAGEFSEDASDDAEVVEGGRVDSSVDVLDGKAGGDGVGQLDSGQSRLLVVVIKKEKGDV
ncbi:hypothetical protein HDU67_002799 [Dinochytrium kinnereticum]|nr:hypothetical protein HDU67_002799 [Dinochytrium kinnereticum]